MWTEEWEDHSFTRLISPAHYWSPPQLQHVRLSDIPTLSLLQLQSLAENVHCLEVLEICALTSAQDLARGVGPVQHETTGPRWQRLHLHPSISPLERAHTRGARQSEDTLARPRREALRALRSRPLPNESHKTASLQPHERKKHPCNHESEMCKPPHSSCCALSYEAETGLEFDVSKSALQWPACN